MSLFNKSDSSESKPTKNKSGSSKFSGNKTWFALAILAALGAAGLIFGILSQMLATTTYYVLNTDVPARSQITPDMLTEVSASQGTQPRNALGLEDVYFEEVYAKVELNTGDVISASNTGSLVPLQQGIPEDFVVASFVADPNVAVAGKIGTGNYIDIIATTDGPNGKTSKAVMRHVLVMDAQTSASDYVASEDVTEGEDVNAQDELRSGLPFLYTVALSEDDAVKLANISGDSLFVTLSSVKADEDFEARDIKTDSGSIFGDDPVSDSGAGTDSSFGAGEDEPTTEGDAQTSEENAEEGTEGDVAPEENTEEAPVE